MNYNLFSKGQLTCLHALLSCLAFPLYRQDQEATRAWFKGASSKGCENEGMGVHLPRMLSRLSLSIPVFFCVCASGEAPSDSVYLLLCPGIGITFQHVASA